MHFDIKPRSHWSYIATQLQYFFHPIIIGHFKNQFALVHDKYFLQCSGAVLCAIIELSFKLLLYSN